MDGTGWRIWRLYCDWQTTGKARLNRMPEIELTGLDGSNLLAYLAALGTLRVLTSAEPERYVRMSWVDRGYWVPVVHGSSAETPDELVELLGRRVCPQVAVMERKKGKATLVPGSDLKTALANANPAFLEDCLDLSQIGRASC